MRKFLVLAMGIAALAIPAAAIATVWPPVDNPNKNADKVAQGAACPQGGTGDEEGGAWYHFVLNQVDGNKKPGITLSATFSVSGVSGPITPTAVNNHTQHFDIFGVGTILSATTGGADPGADSNLVISGVICGKKGTPDRGN